MQTRNFYSLILIFLLFFLFCLGFYLGENSAGAGGYNGDILNVWQNQKTFNNYTLKEAINFTAIYDPQHFHGSRMPLAYILNKFLNPFANNIENFRKSVFLISCIIPFFLYLALSQKYNKSSKYIIGLISSFLFLSPYFRTTGYWGLEENYGILAVILSYYFFYRFMNNDSKKSTNIVDNVALILFSSSCIYFDQKLVIIPLICFLSIILSKKSFYLKFLSSTFYLIFSIPCIYIIYLWGNIIPSVASKNFGKVHLENIAYSITIIAFYLLPLIFLKKEKINLVLKNFFRSKFNLYLIASFLLYTTYLIFYSKLNIPELGGGVFTKITLLISENSIFQKVFFIIIYTFCFFIILAFLNNNVHDFLIIFFFIILSIIIYPVYQEYFDPLIVLLAFTFFKTKLILDFKNTLIILGYYLILLTANNVFYL